MCVGGDNKAVTERLWSWAVWVQIPGPTEILVLSKLLTVYKPEVCHWQMGIKNSPHLMQLF